MRLPQFIASHPELWFSIAEKQFAAADVTTDATKIGYVTSVLDPRYAMEVRDIIVNEPAADAYVTLKTKLIERLSASQEQKTKRLLESEEMGDKKPSQFLRQLRTLAGSEVPDAMLHTLWFSRLPRNIQPILAAQKDLDLNKIAESTPVIAETSKNIANDPLVTILQQIASISQKMDQWIPRQPCECDNNSRSRPRSRSRQDRSWSRSRSRQNSNGVCWYHHTFGANAQ